MVSEISASPVGCAGFLDRHGTIIEDVQYANSLDQLTIYPETIGAPHEVKQAGLRLIVVSNQSGVAPGAGRPVIPR
ncbi:MAG: hypothetical protein HYX75_09550 [Acidobacteria bacterium]|nr:hypothetical protein [Acidobacteriota bacterium]